MTNKQWREDVDGAVAAAGLPWSVSAAWLQQGGVVMCADLSDTRNGKHRSIRLLASVFPTPAERRAEIVRQLQPLK